MTAIALMVITAVAVDTWLWFPFWLAVGAVFLIERVATVGSEGWRGRLLAAPLVPELLYDVYLQIVFVACLVEITLRRRARWGHMRPKTVTGDAR
jgi:hypothetical protein